MDKYWQAMRVYIHTPAAGKSGTQISPLLLLVEGKAPIPKTAPAGLAARFCETLFYGRAAQLQGTSILLLTTRCARSVVMSM